MDISYYMILSGDSMAGYIYMNICPIVHYAPSTCFPADQTTSENDSLSRIIMAWNDHGLLILPTFSPSHLSIIAPQSSVVETLFFLFITARY